MLLDCRRTCISAHPRHASSCEIKSMALSRLSESWSMASACSVRRGSLSAVLARGDNQRTKAMLMPFEYY